MKNKLDDIDKKVVAQIETDIKIDELQSEIEKLRNENRTLKTVIQDNDIDISDISIDIKTEEESICINGISHLAVLFKNGTFTKEDAAMFDILHKNYRLIRGKSVGDSQSKKKNSKEDLGKLLELVSGGKEN